MNADEAEALTKETYEIRLAFRKACEIAANAAYDSAKQHEIAPSSIFVGILSELCVAISTVRKELIARDIVSDLVGLDSALLQLIFDADVVMEKVESVEDDYAIKDELPN